MSEFEEYVKNNHPEIYTEFKESRKKERIYTATVYKMGMNYKKYTPEILTYEALNIVEAREMAEAWLNKQGRDGKNYRIVVVGKEAGE